MFVNTGANSHALRGSNCNRSMFHVESQNSMYVKTCGRALLPQGLIHGQQWFSLTADSAFGHDLLRVAKRFMEQNGGQFAAEKLVPTDLADFSALLFEIRCARPDLVISNLAGNQVTNFLKQYAEFGLDLPDRRVRLRHHTRLGCQQEQVYWRLAGGPASPARHARHEEVCRPFPRAVPTAAGEPGLGSLRRPEDHRPEQNEIRSTDAAKLIEH
jgi:hypothetical protein